MVSYSSFSPPSTPLGLPEPYEKKNVPLRRQIFKLVKIKKKKKSGVLAVGWRSSELCETLWFAVSVIRPAC